MSRQVAEWRRQLDSLGRVTRQISLIDASLEEHRQRLEEGNERLEAPVARRAAIIKQAPDAVVKSLLYDADVVEPAVVVDDEPVPPNGLVRVVTDIP